MAAPTEAGLTVARCLVVEHRPEIFFQPPRRGAFLVHYVFAALRMAPRIVPGDTLREPRLELHPTDVSLRRREQRAF